MFFEFKIRNYVIRDAVQNQSPAPNETESFDINEFLRFASREQIHRSKSN